jgi:hypothetical protein
MRDIIGTWVRMISVALACWTYEIVAVKFHREKLRRPRDMLVRRIPYYVFALI